MKTFITILLSALAFSVIAQSSEQETIKAVVSSAYVKGIHNGGDIEDIRRGFHPTFEMLRLSNNEIKPLSIEEWIANIEKSRQ